MEPNEKTTFPFSILIKTLQQSLMIMHVSLVLSELLLVMLSATVPIRACLHGVGDPGLVG